MSMKFGRAYCEELGSLVSPYRAREIYTDEDSEHYGKELTFGCEDPNCRSRLTPVGIYMVRKSKRALHFRTKEDHKAGCGLLKPGDGGKVRKPSEREDDYKPTNFPTELDLNPPKRKGGGSSSAGGDDGDEGLGGGRVAATAAEKNEKQIVARAISTSQWTVFCPGMRTARKETSLSPARQSRLVDFSKRFNTSETRLG